MPNDNARDFYRKCLGDEPPEPLLDTHDRLQVMWQKNCVGDVPPPTMLWLAYQYQSSNGEAKKPEIPPDGTEVLYTGDNGMARRATVLGAGKFGRVKIEYEGTTKEVKPELLSKA